MRVALSSGLPRLQVSPDLGVGLSTLNKWVQRHQQDDLMSGPQEGVEKETSRLRKEVRLLREERKVLKKNGDPVTVRALHSNVPRDLFAGRSWLDFLASTPGKKSGPWNFSAVSGRSRLVGFVLGGYVQCANDNAMI